MKKVVGLLALIGGLVFTQTSSAGEHRVSPWYIGFGVGFSPNAQFESGGTTYDFEDFSRDSTSGVFRFKVGAGFGGKHLVGGDIGGVSSTGSSAGVDYTVVMLHQIVTYTFFPTGSGFSLRAGAGLGHLAFESDNGYYTLDGTNDGTAVLFGVGYSFWIGRTFNIGLNLDHEVQNYSETDGDFPDVDRASATQFYISFDWY